ncbi:hypothetical protein HS088_TW08G00350 [Tripterygium wilfordii]|uniref:J domain-containing protein n=1 Tax=Tripterygium wilfordii TaxID=458696 RepID=A0A7J7DBP8_TRIWF|nr:uncharacterized protein LOC120003826 [Tripterygium wilfordii]KAF5743763.1 hypothetical protein HS088_TW08G00350 [Tripterygium wilfordii]
MNRSRSGDLNSGFSTSDYVNPNFSFNTPSVPRSSGKAKPRLVKVRKQSNAQHLKSDGATGAASGFNPFQSARGNAGAGSEGPKAGGLGPGGVGFGRSGNDAFVFGASRSDMARDSNSGKWDSLGELGEEVVLEMRDLRIGRGNDSSCGIDESIKKLNIDDNRGDDKPNVKIVDGKPNFGANVNTKLGLGSADNVSSSVGTGVEFMLPDEFKNKLKGSRDTDGGDFTSNANDSRTFQFGGGASSSKGDNSFAESSANALPDRMKTLTIKDFLSTNRVENDKGNLRTKHEDGFAFGSTKDYLDADRANTLSNEIEKKLNIENATGERFDRKAPEYSYSQVSAGHRETGNFCDKKTNDIDKSVPTGFPFQAAMHGNDAHGTQVPVGMVSADRSEKTDGFSFTGLTSIATPFVDFKTPNAKIQQLSGVNQQLEFSAKGKCIRDTKVKKRKDKLKHPTKLPMWPVRDSISKDDGFQVVPEPSESYSPMDVSPYRETPAETQCSGEHSVASDEFLFHNNNSLSTEPPSTISNDAIDEDLVAATQRMDINGLDEECGESMEDGPDYGFDNIVHSDGPAEESISAAETESFKSAYEEIDSDNAVSSAETEVSSIPNIGKQDSDARMQSDLPLGSENITGSNFTFAASFATQGHLSASKPHYKKKNRIKGGHDTYNSTASAKTPYASSSVQFSPFSEASSILSSGCAKKENLSMPPPELGDNSGANVAQEIKKQSNLIPSATVAAQEACEKWRLRGNQAYSNGDLSKAEDYYARGINCIPESETSRSCLRALMLCYSNRAATRMSLGRMRDALGDCMSAIAIDPNFLKVQVRAANCYVALGEVEDASQYFKKCLQSGTDICVDRKVALEASDGLQKVQKVFESIQLATNLLLSRTTKDADTALEVIADALSISSYSEKLLEMRAEALFTLRRYEEVILLCEQTFDSAEMNSPSIDGDSLVENPDGSVVSKSPSFRLWRCLLIFRSLFYLGRLEEAIASLEKQEGRGFTTRGNGSKAPESSIALAVTVRELLRHRAAGNEAFQAGRHSEAIEHYTSALSCNVESRPFAAICFCNRAAAYKALGQITDAIADCSLAIALDGNYLKAICRRATLYEMIRDYGQAATDLQRLVGLLSKKVDEKTSQIGASGASSNLANDLRQARLRLATAEDEARKDIPLDLYLILEVESSVSASEIKKNYRKAALRHHPDKAGQSLARSDSGDNGIWKDIGEEVHKDADRLFKMIAEAYAVLSDPNKRSQYDLEEEMRNAQKKRNGSGTSRTHTDVKNYPFERNSGRRPWKEVFRSYGHSPTKGPEFSWSSRYS